jgi:aspartate/methionine/tyrosine aminotransferase
VADYRFTYAGAVHPAEQIAVTVLDHLGMVRDRSRALLETNRALVNEFLAGRSKLACEPRRFGTTVFPRLRAGRESDFVSPLREQFETSVVSGEFFEQPQHFRIGFCGTTETVRGGLERLGAALDVFGRSPR